MAAVAVRAIRKLPMPLGARIAVLGGGTIGQLVAQVARAAGAMYVLVVDPIGSRRQIAYDVAGVSACAPEDVDATVRSLPQPGLDAVIECTGKPGLVNLGLRLVRPGGTVVCLGMRSGEEAMTLTEIVLGEKHVIGSAAHLWDTDVADAVTMLSDGRIVGQPLITHRVGLDDLVSVGFAALDDPASGALKVIVDCAAPGDGR